MKKKIAQFAGTARAFLLAILASAAGYILALKIIAAWRWLFR